MGFKDVQSAYDIELPEVDGITMATLRGVLNVVAFATDDDTHETFISAAKIAARSGVSESGVRRALNVLEGLSVIDRKKQYRPNGGQSSDLIILNPLVTVTTTPLVTVTRGAGHDDKGGWSPRPGTPSHRDHGKEIIQKDHPDDQPLITVEAIIVDPFDEFWALWPRKVGKPNARTAFDKAAKRVDSSVIIDAATAYAHNPHLPEKAFIPHASTWLNRDGWDDELPIARSNGRPTPTQRAMAIAEAGDSLVRRRKGLAPVTSLTPRGIIP